MDELQPTLLLTRPDPQSRSFLALCEQRLGRHIPAIISPVFEITPLGAPPDLEGFRTLIFTSRNGVRFLSGRLRQKTVVTVGERTAELAREHGAEATALGRNIDEFLARTDQIKGPALHCRGVHTRGGLAQMMTERGVNTSEAIIYEQISRPLTSTAQTLLSGQAPVVMPIFSPRAASLLSRYEMTAPRRVPVLSEAVRAEWSNGGEIVVAAEPTRDAMCDLIEQML